MRTHSRTATPGSCQITYQPCNKSCMMPLRYSAARPRSQQAHERRGSKSNAGRDTPGLLQTCPNGCVFSNSMLPRHEGLTE